MLKFIANRIRVVAEYATRKQLVVALSIDSILLIIATLLTVTFVATRHPFIASPFALFSAFEGIMVGIAVYVLVGRTRENG